MGADSTSVRTAFDRPLRAIEEFVAGIWWYLIVLPKMVMVSAVLAIPFIASIWISFHDWSPIQQTTPFIGLENYVALFNDPVFWSSFINTAGFAIAMVIGVVPLALGIALLLNTSIRGTHYYSAIIFLPVVTSWVVVSLIWTWLYNPYNGLVNILLRSVGLPTYEWLRNPDTALFSIYLMSLWKQIPFHMVIFLAGLQGIPQHLYEAAQVDGAGRYERFRYVTLPQLKPTIFFVVLVQMIFSSRLFAQIFVMTSGGPAHSSYSLVYFFYERGFNEFDFGYASAIAVVLFVIVFVLSIIQQRVWGDTDGV